MIVKIKWEVVVIYAKKVRHHIHESGIFSVICARFVFYVYIYHRFSVEQNSDIWLHIEAALDSTGYSLAHSNTVNRVSGIFYKLLYKKFD